MKKIFQILPHIDIIIALMFIVFYIIDKYFNSAMNFINNTISKGLLFAFCLVSITISVRLIYINRRASRRRLERQSQQSHNHYRG